MFTAIWNYFSGYVMIYVEGLYLERFVNMALAEGIDIWDVRRVNRASISAYISAKDFYRLHSLLRKMRCRVRIRRKYGLPFLFTRMRLRPVMLFGWLLAAALLIALSRFIWFIQVDGCYELTREEVIALLGKIDISAGSRSNGLNLSRIGAELMERDQRIAWAGAQLNGVVLHVELIEAGREPEIVDNTTPANIYAAYDGVIQSITALNGHAMVKGGDAVKKGDLLISGNLSTEEVPELYVRARGDVQARVLFAFTASAGPSIERESRTGVKAPYRAVELFGRRFENPPGFSLYEAKEEKSARLNRFFLPIRFISGSYHELKIEKLPASQEELAKAALEAAEAKLMEQLPKKMLIVSKTSETRVLEDGSVEAVITVQAVGPIGVTIDF